MAPCSVLNILPLENLSLINSLCTRWNAGNGLHFYEDIFDTHRQMLVLNQFSSVTQSCPIFCNPMDCSTPGFLVHHQLPKLVRTHVHWVSDEIQPSHPIIPFFCLQSLPASGSFPMSQFFISGQSIGASASASVLPMNIQDWLPLGWTGWIFSLSKGLSRVFYSFEHCSSKASILQCSAFFIVQLSHPYMTTGKTIALTRWTFVSKVMSLLFNILSR